MQTQRFERHGRQGIKTRVENPHPETLTPLKDARPAVMRVSAAGKDRLQVRALLRAFAFMPFVPNVLRDLFLAVGPQGEDPACPLLYRSLGQSVLPRHRTWGSLVV